MPRVLLNAEDLARLTVRPWGPFSEALLSLRQLQRPQKSGAFQAWRSNARRQLGHVVAPLLVIAPADAFVDLHTVVGAAASFDASMDQLERAKVAHLRSELEYIPPSSHSGAWARTWVRDLMGGDRRARRELVGLFRDYQRTAVGPHWGAISAHIEAERARRGRVMATDGVDGLLATLHPRIRWRPPFLDVDDGDGQPDRVVVLDGLSLVLVPSFFCDDHPHLLRSLDDETAPWLLMYPARRSIADAVPLLSPATQPSHRALEELLGRTRANALEAIAATCSTTELARLLGVSPATASHHAGVLREARLIVTSRDGNAVLHRLTEIGVALLEGRHQQP
jgi:DNA-binding transcriptional ArsR family regulator